jgi:hypothetical protein
MFCSCACHTALGSARPLSAAASWGRSPLRQLSGRSSLASRYALGSARPLA